MTQSGGDIPSEEWFVGLQPAAVSTGSLSTDTPAQAQNLGSAAEITSQPLDLNAATNSLQEQARVQNLFDQRKAPTAANGLCFQKSSMAKQLT